MVRPENAKHMQQPPPRFNVTRVIVVSAILFLLFLLGAWLLVGHAGREMVPKVKRQASPNASWPAPAHRSQSVLRQV